MRPQESKWLSKITRNTRTYLVLIFMTGSTRTMSILERASNDGRKYFGGSWWQMLKSWKSCQLIHHWDKKWFLCWNYTSVGATCGWTCSTSRSVRRKRKAKSWTTFATPERIISLPWTQTTQKRLPSLQWTEKMVYDTKLITSRRSLTGRRIISLHDSTNIIGFIATFARDKAFCLFHYSI